MTSIRARLLIALIGLMALVCISAGAVTYRRVLSETSNLFDYQLRQMALSLRGQVTLAPRVEVPAEQGDTDFVVQIWDLFGARVYLSRPGLPLINRPTLGYADLSLGGETWRAYGLRTGDGVIQVAQPARVRETLARAAALRVMIPLIVLLPIIIAAVIWVVGRGLQPLRLVTAEVQQRDAGTLTPLGGANLPLEIKPLVDELNRLLARLQIAFTAQRAFISDAAHELRSPLTALRLQAQLLDRAPDEAARLEARAQLGAAIERATHLVEQLLTLARSEPQETAVKFEPVALADIAAEAITDCHAMALDRSVELGLDAEPGLRVRGDPEALRALLRNIIDNAVRYTPQGGSVAVRTLARSERALVEIADTGPGIAPEERERVFDRFYRRPGTAAPGTGLGLAIVKAIAERHGARVLLGDAAGGALRVTVEFPRLS
ncbi:MAG: ATP-binding protein [Steroidobacteraceae bacterium]|jgi:two-component system OmpR family sensor kinase/two-component system sensor histidine kinase QseC